MRLLLDKNLSYRPRDHLTAAGYDAVHVDDVGLAGAADIDILDFARTEDCTIVSSDTDGGMLLAAQRAAGPSVILTGEVSTFRTKQLADLLVANLPLVGEDLAAGAMVAVGRRAIRVRRLPLR